MLRIGTVYTFFFSFRLVFVLKNVLVLSVAPASMSLRKAILANASLSLQGKPAVIIGGTSGYAAY